MTISFETFGDELTYDALPVEVLAILRRSFTDTIGVAAVGSTTPLSKIARRVAPMLFGSGTAGTSRMLMDGTAVSQVTQRWANNRAENSHLPFRRRERAMLRFRRMHSLQKFASIHASFHNLFNSQRSLSKRSTFKLNRDAALTEWRSLIAS